MGSKICKMHSLSVFMSYNNIYGSLDPYLESESHTRFHKEHKQASIPGVAGILGLAMLCVGALCRYIITDCSASVAIHNS